MLQVYPARGTLGREKRRKVFFIGIMREKTSFGGRSLSVFYVPAQEGKALWWYSENWANS